MGHTALRCFELLIDLLQALADEILPRHGVFVVSPRQQLPVADALGQPLVANGARGLVQLAVGLWLRLTRLLGQILDRPLQILDAISERRLAPGEVLTLLLSLSQQ